PRAGTLVPHSDHEGRSTMSTKTYSEQRQAILFKASRDLRAVAASVLDDVVNEVELTSSATLGWAKSVAATTAKLAQELEDKGHEQGGASTRAENDLYKTHRSYDIAIEAFHGRIRAAGGTAPA